MLGFMLDPTVSWPLLLLLLYSIFCLGSVVLLDAALASRSAIQIGIFTGVPVSLIYVMLFPIATGIFPAAYIIGALIAGSIAFLLVRGIVSWCGASFAVFAKTLGFICLGLGTIAMVFMLLGEESLSVMFVPVIAVVMTNLVCATVWCLGVYLDCSIRVIRLYPSASRFSLLGLMSLITWLAAFLAALRWSVLRSFAEYSKLPLEAPSQCYVATAAARGHRRFVRSESLVAASGDELIVNPQLARLKAAELSVMAISPTVHRIIRYAYDRLGPPLASRLRNPLLADAAYVVLKPAEWCAMFFVKCCLGAEAESAINKLYLGRLSKAFESHALSSNRRQR